MRCAAKEEQRQAVFFFKIKVYILPQWCQSCLQTGHFAQQRRRELLLSPSFPSFEFFWVCFRDILLGSLFSWCCFVFLFSRLLWCILSTFPDPGLLSVQYSSAFSPLCLSLSATAQCTTRELHHSLFLPTGQDEEDFSSKTLKANANQHSSCKSPSTLKKLWEEIEALLLYQKHSK